MTAEYDPLIGLTTKHYRHSDQTHNGVPRIDRLTLDPNFNPGLLRVSRQVYSETAPILYSRNSFVFEGLRGLDAFPFFHQRLTETSLLILGYLHITFPPIRRICSIDEASCGTVLEIERKNS